METACISVVVLGMETRSWFAETLVVELTELGSWVGEEVEQEEGGVKCAPEFICLCYKSGKGV